MTICPGGVCHHCTSQCSLEALQGLLEAIPFSNQREIQSIKLNSLNPLNRVDFNLGSLIPGQLVPLRHHLELVQVPLNSVHLLPLHPLQVLLLIMAVKKLKYLLVSHIDLNFCF